MKKPHPPWWLSRKRRTAKLLATFQAGYLKSENDALDQLKKAGSCVHASVLKAREEAAGHECPVLKLKEDT